MSPDFVRRMSAPVPRYTSYPTAAQFRNTVGERDFAEALLELEDETPFSLYVHVPFCKKLCWYCGCNMKVARTKEPVVRYFAALEAELRAVAALGLSKHKISYMHWGGGSPNILTGEQILALTARIRDSFEIDASAEFAVEIDPREASASLAHALKRAGVNRVSIGVQDFDHTVQTAINRLQSFEVTSACVDSLRDAGIDNINVDLVYGLPLQTRSGIERTVEQVLALQPNRVTLFGYAHLPSRFAHQSIIDATTLPDSVERFAQSQRAARMLAAAGYVRIGLDHFALKNDPLARGPVRRNFQGYTTDTSETLVGVGPSAISCVGSAYFQNVSSPAEYEERIAATGLATTRGVKLTDEDRVRRYVIAKLMCDFSYSESNVRERFGAAASRVILEGREMVEADIAGLLEKVEDGFVVTPRGQPFVRSIAACFDTYLGSDMRCAPAV
ncbi:oxygen-independent coproporphyrinogen III oxidase [Hyphomicrobium sp.]|uniref:oxygen-independent coproporphyrinogen III oxidase n=1 Tax=Hyphomicrobium sp. TaxID=82 RepID=UPI000F9F9206|nr:oxygen-independent coproporphyrinogen III oxidase [Hyphomicrobium sp.]RUP09170.1 MAG: oxygen-independent coproporphyrinogen III oxidase [Hyphomicrobium sp.]